MNSIKKEMICLHRDLCKAGISHLALDFKKFFIVILGGNCAYNEDAQEVKS